MPGIGNKYFRIRARTLNVASMSSAPAGYALGVFRRQAAGPRPGSEFTGLVRGDRVRDVSVLGMVNDLLADWEPAQRRLAELAEDDGQGDNGDNGDWTDLAALDVRCPVSPGQILQCGANYRKHVVGIVLAERATDESITGHNSDVPEEEVRLWAEAMMDDRAKTGSPYVFAGRSGRGRRRSWSRSGRSGSSDTMSPRGPRADAG